MDTAQLKKFAQEARKSLMGTVEAKLGVVLAEDSLARRESKSAVSALEGLINEIGKDQVIEKVAYTWFNRFCALRFMDANHYNKIGIVSPVEGQTQPEILAEAKMGYYDDSVVDTKIKDQINKLLNSSQDDAYKLLLVSYCNFLNKQLPFMFEKINDYTELLMPDDLLSTNSVLSQTVAVLDTDTCKDVEVIGWLYQYYISEKKDEVFADLKKGKKISKDNVPAATQIFTPKWIVSYMVENSVGKLWLESHPDSILQSKFKYYLESAEQDENVKQKLEELKNKDIQPQDIKVLDPACGSGHILVKAFDVLFEIYKAQGWQDNEIPELILRNNLYGLDICDRASQLAQFAVMMKARQYDRGIFNKVSELNICSIKDTNWLDYHVAQELMNGVKDEKLAKEQIELLQDTFRDAKEYGSIIDVKGFDFEFWEERINYFKNLGQSTIYSPIIRGRLWYSIKQSHIMQQKYECVISNPPYMGIGNSNDKLSEYAKKYYFNSKADLFSIFIEKCLKFRKNTGYVSMITMQSWMFLPSFEKMRDEILENNSISSMIHLGSRAFGSNDVGTIVQTTSFVIGGSSEGIYLKLTDFSDPKSKEDALLFAINNYTNYKYSCNKNIFKKIPGHPIAYWVTPKFLQLFDKKNIGEIAISDGQTKTGDNDRFLRNIWEVDSLKIGKLGYKWVKHVKGGAYRKWYGNIDTLINWSDSARQHYRSDRVARITPEYLWFRKGLSWTLISEHISIRLLPEDCTFNLAAPSLFFDNEDDIYPIMGFLNSKIAFKSIKLFNPTFNTNIGDICVQPADYLTSSNYLQLTAIVKDCINISKDDWDSFEISWDFKVHPLLRFANIHKGLVDGKISKTLPAITDGDKVEDCFKQWKSYKQEQFNKLKANEEELNRLFIEIYGLQDEMTSDVADKDITIALADEKREIKSLLSYAVGCMFGRYSLDREGLVFAGGEFDKSNYTLFEADEDGIIPILSEHYFCDDITERFKKFLKVAFGETFYEENLDYIATVLGKKTNETADDTIRNYFLKDFYNDHVKLYQKRPIYWLFSSKNGNFNALIYLHRYNKDTVNRILNNYLREYEGKLEQSINNNKHILTSSLADRDKSKAQKEIETAQKIVNEIKDYERDVIYPLATQRKEIDLDDGVKVNYLKFGKALKNIGLKA